MGDVLALALYVPLLGGAALAVWRTPLVALYLFLVGLAVHNLALSLLYDAGVRGVGLDAIQAWKEVLLGVAIARVATDVARERRLPFRPNLVDGLAASFAVVALLYAVLPQSLLDGEAGAKAVLYGLRHALVPVAAYFVGRSVAGLGRAVPLLLSSAAAVALFGLLDDFLVSVEWWRGSGAVGYYRDELGFDYHGPGGLPDNWAFNAGAEEGLYRRLVSTFVSPLGTAFMMVVALLVAAARPLRSWRPAAAAALCFVALLFTLSRSSLLVLAGGLVVLALARRAWWPAVAAVAVVAVSFAFLSAYQSFAPETHFFAEDLPYQEQQAKKLGDVDGGLIDPAEPSIRSHLTNLRDGLEKVARHPQGYGLGNAGAVASRFNDEPPQAGESNYTETGIELGVLGLALFLAWNLALLARLAGRREWLPAALGASLAAVLALAVQTDAYGVPWLAFCLWWLAGSAVSQAGTVEK